MMRLVSPGEGTQARADTPARAVRAGALTQAPNDSFAELRQVYAGDDRLRVPPAVRNAVRQRDEVR